MIVLPFLLKTCKGLTTPARLISFAFTKHRAKTLLIRGDTGDRLTFGDVEKRSLQLLAFLRQQGLVR